MTGIQFLTDAKGHKTSVVIDLKTHKPFGRSLRTFWSPGRAAVKRAFRLQRSKLA
jgi:hypothetical protein